MFLPLVVQKIDGFYRIPLFERFNLMAIFTARSYNMSFDAKDRRRAFTKMSVDSRRIVCPSQVHKDTVAIVGKEQAGRGVYARATAIPETDALITRERLLPLAIQTADCLSVFLFDPRQRVIALVHAGWRGVAKKILLKTVHIMERSYSVDPSAMVAVLGPALRSCCYEVGDEFKEYFPNFLRTKEDRMYFDISAAAIDQLDKSGIKSGHIYDTQMCTSCQDKEFFSYRREGVKAGRSMSIFAIL